MAATPLDVADAVLELDELEVVVLNVVDVTLLVVTEDDVELVLEDTESIVMVDVASGLGPGETVIAPLVGNIIGMSLLAVLADAGWAFPVVLVTTATLHSACMPWPARNSATIEWGSTVTPLHAVVISPFVCTKPFRQLCEQTYGAVKSVDEQPAIGCL